MKINILAVALGLSLAVPTIVSAQTTGGAMARPQTGLSAQEYVDKASDGDMYEVESSRIALARSQTPAVREHAQRMIDDHTKTTMDLRKAIAMGKTPDLRQPAMMTPRKQADVAMLEKADMADFDKSYIAGQMASHQEALSVHQGYAKSGQDPALKMAAKKTVPIVQGHLRHLKMMKGM